MRRLSLAIAAIAIAASPAEGQRSSEDALPSAQLAKVFPGAESVVVQLEAPPTFEARRNGARLGYVFSTRKIVDSKGYSGKPIDIWVGLDLQGKIVGTLLVAQQEPILVIGISEQALANYVGRFRGVDVRTVVRIGRPRGPHEIGVDAISGATASSAVITDAIMRSARIVARARGILQAANDAAGLDLDDFEPLDWNGLLRSESVARLTLSHRAVDERIGVPLEGVSPDGNFIDLYVALVSPALIGRNLLGERNYATMTASAAPGGQAIFIGSSGLYSFKGTEWLRTGVFDRVRVIQGAHAIALTRAGHTLIERLEAAGAPELREMARFAIPVPAKFDPARPWVLELTVRRARTDGGDATATFQLAYRPPARLLRPAPPPAEIKGRETKDAIAAAEAPIWRQIWQERAVHIALLLIILTALTAILFFQDALARRQRLYRPLRVAFLLVTLIYVGWIAGAQISVINVLTFAQAMLTGFHWEDFLLEPLIFILWCYVAVTILFWGRGVFCGWLCPFGALQELLNRLMRLFKLPQIAVPFGLHERLWPLKYVAFLALFAVSLGSMSHAVLGSEIEPFKTAISLRFAREWQFLAYVALLLNIGLIVERFFCRYLCPLGAALAIPARLRMFDWLKRRHQCGSVCQACAVKCTVQAIHPDGRINPNECIHCLECQVHYFDDRTCPPLIERRKRRERREALASEPAAPGKRATP